MEINSSSNDLHNAAAWLIRTRAGVTDATTQKIIVLGGNIPDAALAARSQEFRAQLDQALMSVFPKPASTILECTQALHSLTGWIEGEFRKILSGHSPLFWIILYRAIPWWQIPDKDVNEYRPFATEVDLTATLAFLKFGDWNRNDDVEFPLAGPFEANATAQDLLEWQTSLEVLLFLCRAVFYHKSRLRKGAVLDSRDGDMRSELPAALEASHNLHLERRKRYQSVLTPRGIPAYPRYVRKGNAPNKHEVAQLRLRMETVDHPNLGLGAPIIAQGYSPELIELDEVFLNLEIFRTTIEKTVRLSPEALTRVYRVFNMFLMGACTSPVKEIQYASLRYGLLVLPQKVFLSKFAEMICIKYPAISCQIAETEADLFLKHLTADRDAALRENIFIGTGTGCIHAIRGYIFIDLAHTCMPLVDLAYRLKANASQKREKGVAFERYLLDYVSKCVPNINMPMAPNTRLSAEGRVFAEVDLWIQIDDVLLAIDCKAWCQSAEYLQADPAAMIEREALFERLLSDGDKRASKIARAPRGDNYSLPPGVRGILALVCSPDSEFVDVSNPTLMLTERITRVCTPSELVEIAKKQDISAIMQHPCLATVKV